MKANKLICTVGISLKSNIANSPEGEHDDLKKLWSDGQWGQLAARLRKLDATARICGAEINSIHDLLAKESLVERDAGLVFCVSDTRDGKDTGAVLKSYYEADGRRAEIVVVDGLQDENPEEFRLVGLRNLARRVGEIVSRAGGAGFVAINATGGYKAQIAIAVLVGQVLGVPVYYKHEKFGNIISLPPMPVAFDYDLLGQNADLLDALETSDTIVLPEESVDERLRPLLEGVAADGQMMWELAPVGQVYLEGYRQRHPEQQELPPPAAPDERTEPRFADHHYPGDDKFREFVRKVWREQPFITGCHTLPYDHNRGIRDREFHIRADGQIVGNYRSDTYGARFAINTTARTISQKTAVVFLLNRQYGRR